MVSSDTNDLHTCWKAHQIGAESKSGSLSCSNTDRGAHRIKDGEDDRSEDGEGGDFIKW